MFTLAFEDKEEQDLGKVEDYVVVQNVADGKSYSRYIYSVDNPYSLIDDNSLTLDEKGNYMLFNQGFDYGYSVSRQIIFLPNKLKNGSYNFQVVAEIQRNGYKIYSNIIRIDLPLSGVN